MTKKDLIRLVKKDVVEVAKKLKKEPTYPSTTIARILWLYQSKQIDDNAILANNNPLGLTNPETGELMEFTTLQQCFIVADERPFQDDDFDNKKDNIIKYNQLNNFDKVYVYSESENTDVQVPPSKKKPKIDQYKVKKDDTVVLKTDNLQEAEKVAKEKKATIYNSRGAIVNEKYSYNVDKATSHTLVAGSAVTCNKIYLYKNYNSNEPLRLINGTYYIYDGRTYGSRIAICMNPDAVKSGSRTSILGFINKKDIIIN